MRHVATTLALAAFFFASPLYAQLDTGFGPDLSLTLSPHYPAPRDVVRVVAHSTLIPLSEATVAWYIDGKKVSESIGAAEKEVTVGILGSETLVLVRAARGDEVAEKSIRIRPTEMDLLWESDAYIPPFFRGRSLPSAGTTLKMEALPRFKLKSGAQVPLENIVFTWRRNGYVIANVSGRGRSRARIPAPALFGADGISVEARSIDGIYGAEISTIIRSEEPHLSVYENHPLFGIQYHAALGAQNFFDATEVSLAAIPYYADASDQNDGALIYAWEVNGQPILLDPEKPSELTLNAAGSSGIALIELALSHATNFYLNAQGAWRLTLLGEGSATENPFTR